MRRLAEDKMANLESELLMMRIEKSKADSEARKFEVKLFYPLEWFRN